MSENGQYDTCGDLLALVPPGDLGSWLSTDLTLNQGVGVEGRVLRAGGVVKRDILCGWRLCDGISDETSGGWGRSGPLSYTGTNHTSCSSSRDSQSYKHIG